MQVLFVSPFFYPERISTGRYNTFFVEALEKEGASVSVVCSHPFYPEWSVTIADDRNGPPDVHRAGAKVRYPRSQLLRRALLEIWFARFVRRRARSGAVSADVVVQVFPPNLFALPIGRYFGDVPRIGIVHDLQGIMMHSEHSIIRRFASKFVRRLESSALRSCSHLIFLSQEMLQKAAEEYDLDGVACEVAYPFCTIAEARNGTSQDKRPSILQGKQRTLVYSGALGEKQSPDMLGELFNRFSSLRDDFDVFVFSSGPIFERLEREYGGKGSRIHFHGLVPNDELTGLLRSSTIQVIPQAAGSSSGAFPSKLPNIINTGTAIFAITDETSELNKIVSSYSRGCVETSRDIDVLVHSLSDFADRILAESAEPGITTVDKELRKRFEPGHLARFVLQTALAESP